MIGGVTKEGGVTYYYRPQQSCGMVIFSQAAVSHSAHHGMGGGVCPSMHYRSHDRGVSVRGSLLGRPPYRNERVVRILVECILVRSNVPENGRL